MTGYHLIIDIGGTTTQVAVAQNGAVVARTELPSYKPKPPNQQTADLCKSLGAWLASVSPEFLTPGFVLLGVAGVWDAIERQVYLNSFTDDWLSYVADVVPRTSVLSDLELAMFAGLGAEAGTLLIAGTGSIAARRTPEGDVRRAGGWGPRIDDAGGGFWMGREALGAVARSLDGRGPETQLRIPVAAFLRVDANNTRQLANAVRNASIERSARLAQAVVTYAADGDVVAMRIRDRAIVELMLLVDALEPSTDVSEHVVLHGSLFANEAFLELTRRELEVGRGLATRHMSDLLSAAAVRLTS